MLSKRLELLQEVQRFQESLEVPGDVSYTCETAGHFFLYQVCYLLGLYIALISNTQELMSLFLKVLSRWEEYLSKVKPGPGKVCEIKKKISNLYSVLYLINSATLLDFMIYRLSKLNL